MIEKNFFYDTLLTNKYFFKRNKNAKIYLCLYVGGKDN